MTFIKQENLCLSCNDELIDTRCKILTPWIITQLELTQISYPLFTEYNLTYMVHLHTLSKLNAL